MPGEGPGNESSIVASGYGRWRRGAPGERFGIARVVCVVGLFALLVSAISPVDDSVQPDLSRHSSSWHRTAIVSKLTRPIRLTRRHCALTPIKSGADAAPILHSARAVPVPHACSSWVGFERTHTGRAPPAPSLLTA